MSKYENNISGKLQQIYDIKGEIAEVIGTNSTDFSEYPSLIGDAIKYAGGSGETIAQKNTAWQTKWATALSTMAAGLYQQDAAYGEPQISTPSGWCIQTAIDGDAAMSEMIPMACLWIEIYGGESILHEQYVQIFTQMGLTLDSDGFLVSTDDDKLIPFDADEALISNLIGVVGYGVVGGKRISSLSGGVEKAPWNYYGSVFNGTGFDYVYLGQFDYVVDQSAMIQKMNADGVTFINDIPAVNQSTLFNYLEAFQIDEYTPYQTKNITTNGTVDVTSYASAVVNVPTGITPSGTITIDDNYNNTTVDVTNYAYADVQISGGGGEAVDPFYEAVGFSPELVGETVPYVSTTIGDKFQVNEKGGEIDSIEYDYAQDDGNGGTWNVHVLLDSDPYEMFLNSQDLDFTTYPDLYENVFPIVENAVVTISEDPKNYDYLITGGLYAWNVQDNSGAVETITENGFVPNSGATGYDIQVPTPGDGLVGAIDSHVFVSIRPGLTGYSNYPYFSPNESVDGGEQSSTNNYLVPFTDTYDVTVNVHTLISDSFPSWGIDPNDFVSSIKVFRAYDWDNGRISSSLNDLTCTTMLQEGNSSSECWCLVEGTLQNDTDVCFKAETGIWDSMQNLWDMQQDETLLECMPVVKKYQDPYSLYGWSTTETTDGTYISLPACSVRLYLHYGEGGDAPTCNVFYNVYDGGNSQWTPKWYNISATAEMTFVNPNSNA